MQSKKNLFKILGYAYWTILVWPFWITIALLEYFQKGINSLIQIPILVLDYIQEQIQDIGDYIFKNT